MNELLKFISRGVIDSQPIKHIHPAGEKKWAWIFELSKSAKIALRDHSPIYSISTSRCLRIMYDAYQRFVMIFKENQFDHW